MFKKCMKCGSVVYVVNGNSNITCCGSDMKELIPNSVDAAFEKHVPNVEVIDNKIRATVNHVMEDDHYIEWIALVNDKETLFKKLNPNDIADVIFNYSFPATIYSYCNRHGLWKKDIDNIE